MHKFILATIVLFVGTLNQPSNSTFAQQNSSNQKLTSFVNPFIETGGHDHTYPGATMLFGMMQLRPDTRVDGWNDCSGYHYSDEYIYGLSNIYFSGTGVSDYDDVFLMPTNEIFFNNSADGKNEYRAHFFHENEKASSGYYKVLMDDTNIDVELTVSERSVSISTDFRMGTWQGYQDTDLNASVDLGSVKNVKSVAINFLQNQHSWIFYPTEVTYRISTNGADFTELPKQKINAEKPSEDSEIKTIEFEIDKKVRYLKIIAKNFGDLPKEHLGESGKAWLFVDEIEIN